MAVSRRTDGTAEGHDLVSPATSGLLDRLGYEVKPATYDSIFRNPDGVSRSLQRASAESRRDRRRRPPQTIG